MQRLLLSFLLLALIGGSSSQVNAQRFGDLSVPRLETKLRVTYDNHFGSSTQVDCGGIISARNTAYQLQPDGRRLYTIRLHNVGDTEVIISPGDITVTGSKFTLIPYVNQWLAVLSPGESLPLRILHDVS